MFPNLIYSRLSRLVGMQHCSICILAAAVAAFMLISDDMELAEAPVLSSRWSYRVSGLIYTLPPLKQSMMYTFFAACPVVFRRIE